MMFRLFLVFFLEIFICILINFKAGTNSDNDFEAISRVVAICFLAIMTLFVLLMFLVTAIESDPERDPNSQPIASLHYIYLDMSNKRRTQANIYLIAYMLRRAVYAIVVIMMQDYPALQLLILLLTSGLVTAIILRGKPYLTNMIKWQMAFYEFLFAWVCTLCMMFSAEYMHRSFEIAADMANAVNSITGCVALFGLINLIYSLIWQIQFNMRRKANMELASEMARRPPRVKKQKKVPIEPIEEQSSEESYRMDRRKQR